MAMYGFAQADEHNWQDPTQAFEWETRMPTPYGMAHRFSMLPLAWQNNGDLTLAWPQVALDTLDAVKLPGDAMQGKITPTDANGNANPEFEKRLFNLSMLTAGAAPSRVAITEVPSAVSAVASHAKPAPYGYRTFPHNENTSPGLYDTRGVYENGGWFETPIMHEGRKVGAITGHVAEGSGNHHVKGAFIDDPNLTGKGIGYKTYNELADYLGSQDKAFYPGATNKLSGRVWEKMRLAREQDNFRGTPVLPPEDVTAAYAALSPDEIKMLNGAYNAPFMNLLPASMLPVAADLLTQPPGGPTPYGMAR